MNIKHKIFFILLVSISLCEQSSAQSQKIRPLTIGDKVPDISFQLVDGNKGKLYRGKLSDYKGKLVILDFWASWCWACVKKFPKMDTIQMKFANKIKVIMVNSQIFGGQGDGLKYMAKQKEANKWPFQFTLAFDDTIAYELFPSYGIPHYAWINGERRVVAITDGYEVTDENIEKVITGEDIDFPMKKDFFPNKIAVGQLEINDDLLAFSLLKRGKIIDGIAKNIPMISELYSTRGDKKQERGFLMKNLPLPELYKYALKANSSKSRVILEVKDPSKLECKYSFQIGKSSADFITKEENLYTYQLIVPIGAEDEIRSRMLADLNTSSGYVGKIEKRKVNCLVIEPIDKLINNEIKNTVDTEPQLPKSSADNVLHFSNIEVFVLELNKYSILDEWVHIDDKGLNSNLKCDFVIDLNKPGKAPIYIEEQLKNCGLHFVHKQLELEMLVISDQK